MALALALAAALATCVSCTTPARRDDPRDALDVPSNVDAGSGAEWDSTLALPPPTQLALGESHTCWLAGQGRNESGVLGDGTLEDRSRPAPVALSSIARLSTGPLHACAIDSRASLHCWGLNEHGGAGPRSGPLTDTASLSEATPRARGGVFPRLTDPILFRAAWRPRAGVTLHHALTALERRCTRSHWRARARQH